MRTIHIADAPREARIGHEPSRGVAYSIQRCAYCRAELLTLPNDPPPDVGFLPEGHPVELEHRGDELIAVIAIPPSDLPGDEDLLDCSCTDGAARAAAQLRHAITGDGAQS